jgi:hypothetical protein
MSGSPDRSYKHEGSTGGSGIGGAVSYELDELLHSPSLDSQQREAKDRKGKLIVDKYLERHHHSQRNLNGNSAPNSKPKNAKKLDEYGFIVNIDDKGTIRSEDSFYLYGGASTPAEYDHPDANGHVNGHSKGGKMMPRLRRKNSDPNGHRSPSTQQNINSQNQANLRASLSDQPPPNDNSAESKTAKRERKLLQKLQLRREKKWNQMIAEYKSIKSSKPKLKKLHSRVRKGIPNSIRGKAWVTMANIDLTVKGKKGVYAKLVEHSCTDRFDGIHEALLPFIVDINDEEEDLDKQEEHQQQHVDPTADIMKETIERDINRTFPRHSMFYDSYSDSESDDDEEESDDVVDYKTDRRNNSTYTINELYEDEELSDESFDKVSFSGSLGSTGHGFNNSHEATGHFHVDHDFLESETTDPHNHHGSKNNSSSGNGDHCWSKSVRAIEKATGNCPPAICVDSKKRNALVPIKTPHPLPPSANTPNRKEKKKKDITTEEGGQASLRRVLRAYSTYDPEVGYCQGMNFIAGMFITFVSEEEAFWLLVNVMSEKPCCMRGLFGVGMSEAHQVLYVAEKLIAQFNPRLSKHFDRENIHVTMFATQWLLTMFTSSFPFHVVTRVWDCFILEGWKMTYRVMLALLDYATPVLLKYKFEDILNYFKVLPFQIDVNVLLRETFNVPLKKKHIEKYAKEWDRKQEKEKAKKAMQQQQS